MAERYAAERIQVAIPTHADIRRRLLEMRVRAEAARLIALQTAAWVDAGDKGDEAAAARTAIMLPTAKAFGAEAAFANADSDIQVLRSAGYVDEWPVERLLRDCRVFSIHAGTTTIQGLDLLNRRVLGEGGQAVLRDVLAHLVQDPGLVTAVMEAIARLEAAPLRVREAASVSFLRLLGLACAHDLLHRAGCQAGELCERHTALACFFVAQTAPMAAVLAEHCTSGYFDGCSMRPTALIQQRMAVEHCKS